MINGLGLFAALGATDAPATPPAPVEDPAVFAAALVAALGLRAAVQETPVATAPSADASPEPANDETESEAADGESRAVTVDEPAAEPAGGNRTRSVAARITPDPEIVKESKTLGTVLRGESSRSTRNIVDLVSDEPAAPAISGTGTTVQADAVVDPGVIQRLPVPAAPEPTTPKASAPDAEPDTLLPETNEVADETPVRRPNERRGSRALANEPTVELTGAGSVPAPIVSVAPVGVVVPPVVAPVSSTPVAASDAPPAGESVRDVPDVRLTAPARPGTASQQGEEVSPTRATADAARQVAEATPAPPQSVEERTARAIAENTRVERQLAELLGEAEITEFKVQLGRRPIAPKPEPAPDASAPTDRAAGGRVIWQRTNPLAVGDTISGQMLPQTAPPVKADRSEARGTLAREAAESVNIQAASSEPITISTATARSEIVRMVANASRAMAPNVAATEGAPAVAKAPAPSLAPSLPVVRQELPADPPRSPTRDSDERDRKPARETSASDAPSPSSLPVANNSTAGTTRSERAESAEPREARNLPSHGSDDQKTAGSADRVTLQVADDEGRQTRIRVSVTGNQIRAVITPPDSASARQLEQRMDQLHETLVRQGFADPKLVIRAAPQAASEAALMANAGSQDGRSTVPAGKDQPAGEQRQGRGQREHDRGDGHRHPQGHSRERDPRDRRR